ncbi:ABC transporter ATP-binding protein [Leptospira licerasiae]|uniref:ABC transporter, ATP-binding protein n=1 Tax=Leptospira licerasiae str. MMD4847 TaxID=1049971 RepID=A0ABN0H6U9_9LEPT|nr:ABC transporter ATP-binding protein [Leptospira licerasiae]EIE03009.1 ABC transporter, ATP-binding protein [Leptospira licerasiae serovar Varillal str. VAR 010]EJZ41197.1 ABC transporter, ATP-binding protein [Leptospira licerasiae str. MMD4847]TGM90364.1 ABC transporter ATP-binding protein [Leptospira licerasiae]
MKPDPNTILSCDSLVKSFGEPATLAINNVSLSMKKGEFVSLTGRSGSGKSTLLYMLSGLDIPTSGKVYLDGKDLFQMESKEAHRFRNENIGFVFQFHYLLPELSAIENILMPARKIGEEGKKRDYARSLLKDFGLEQCKDKYPSQMSGGEQQRAAIARALIMDPGLIFADEPTGNLDTANGDKTMEIFKRRNKENGTTILYVTHDPEYAALADRRINMVDGQIESDQKQNSGKKKSHA